MPRSFKLPDLGEGIHEAEIQEILISPGEEVEEDQIILVVETDKAAVEVPSPYGGGVKSVDVEVGDLVKVGAPLLTFQDGEGEAEPPADKQAAAEPASAAQEQEKSAPQAAQDRDGQERSRPVPASPATRRLARELNVNLRDVPPSGPEGLVTAEDVRSFAKEGEAPAAEKGREPRDKQEFQGEAKEPADDSSVRPSLIRAPALPDLERFGPTERVPLRSVRRATARQMALAWSQIPHVSHHEAVDITELAALRRRHKDEIEAQGGRLTLTLFVLKAAVAALKAHRRFNASLDADAQEIVLRQSYHLGLATATDRGLLVPVIRDVDRKSISELSREVVELVERTQAGEASLEDLQGSTFTVTNIGVIGGDSFAPIINYPNVAILGVARASWQPVVRGEGEQAEIAPRYMLPLVLAFDHRVVDGADAAYFMRDLVGILQQPDRLALAI